MPVGRVTLFLLSSICSSTSLLRACIVHTDMLLCDVFTAGASCLAEYAADKVWYPAIVQQVTTYVHQTRPGLLLQTGFSCTLLKGVCPVHHSSSPCILIDHIGINISITSVIVISDRRTSHCSPSNIGMCCLMSAPCA